MHVVLLYSNGACWQIYIYIKRDDNFKNICNKTIVSTGYLLQCNRNISYTPLAYKLTRPPNAPPAPRPKSFCESV